jgi:hypothetical protein
LSIGAAPQCTLKVLDNASIPILAMPAPVARPHLVARIVAHSDYLMLETIGYVLTEFHSIPAFRHVGDPANNIGRDVAD